MKCFRLFGICLSALLAFVLTISLIVACSKHSAKTVAQGNPPRPPIQKEKQPEPTPEPKPEPTCEETAKKIDIPVPTFAGEWQKRAWIQKLSRRLRLGKEVARKELDALVARPPLEIIETFKSSPEFTDMVLDFNLFFLGTKVDELRDRKTGDFLTGVIEAAPASAIASARKLAEGGDYLALLDYQQPWYMEPLAKPFTADEEDRKKPDEEVRQILQKRVLENIDQQIAYVDSLPGGEFPWKQYCEKFYKFEDTFLMSLFGLNYSDLFRLFASDTGGGRILFQCILGGGETPPFPGKSYLQQMRTRYAAVFAHFAQFEPSRYHPRQLNDLQAADPRAVGIEQPNSMFNSRLAQFLTNSSTNYNRKRASYILKRFYCDDLTPINVERPDDHSRGDAHGSEASCFACHYKLDPMAGYFRNYGFVFTDYGQQDRILFDDAARTDRKAYADHWKAPSGAGRDWDVGYIRSVKQAKFNDYGESLADLFTNLRKAPEVKRCLVKRLFQYLNSEAQTMDSGYLDHLAEGFTEQARCNSGKAFKDTIAAIVVSQTFRQEDPRADECYDFPPGYDPKDAPPCAVHALLQKNCTSCHDSTLDDGQLDLSRWVRMSDGTFGFPHLDSAGQQRDRARTLTLIAERLNTQNDKERMPKGRFMTPVEREQIYHWVNDQLITTTQPRGSAKSLLSRGERKSDLFKLNQQSPAKQIEAYLRGLSTGDSEKGLGQ